MAGDDDIDDWIDKVLDATVLPNESEDVDEAAGPPLSVKDIEDAEKTLTRWQSATEFKASVDAFCSRCNSKDWFNRPQLKFLHDAFVLARFAVQHPAEEVRLTERAAQWPDGFVRIEKRTYNIEVTSTHGGRKLGKEYSELKGLTMDPGENWVQRAESIPFFLDKTVASKSQKHYSAPCWLVVYLNIDEYGIRQKETEAVIAAVKARYGHAFKAISVMWKGHLY